MPASALSDMPPVSPCAASAWGRSRFLNVKKVTKERRVFAVGAPARRSRDGNGKIAAPAGPVTGQPGFAAGEMRPNGSKGRGGNGSRVWEKRKAPAFAGLITKSADGVTFLMLRK